MGYKKIRDNCNEVCPMYNSINALNSFINSEKNLKCPKQFCDMILNKLDEDGLLLSDNGNKIKFSEGYFTKDGNFLEKKYNDIDETKINEINVALEEINDNDLDYKLNNNEYEVVEGNVKATIENKLELIEDYFIGRLGDSSYFFKQCRDIDLNDELVTFFNTKNNLINYKSLENLSKEEREEKILYGHEYRISFKDILSMNIKDLRDKLDIFYKSLYESLNKAKEMSCEDCRWQKQGAKYTATDCMTCSRNKKSKVPKDNLVDNYS